MLDIIQGLHHDGVVHDEIVAHHEANNRLPRRTYVSDDAIVAYYHSPVCRESLTVNSVQLKAKRSGRKAGLCYWFRIQSQLGAFWELNYKRSIIVDLLPRPDFYQELCRISSQIT